MTELYSYFQLVRIKQWYKNLVIFLPLVFTLSLLNLDSLFLTIVGFIALGLASSALYIRNDILDIDFDKQHPVKKLRSLASGKISKKNAYIIFVLLLSSSLIIAAIVNWQLVIVLIFLFVNTTVYSQCVLEPLFAYCIKFSISPLYVPYLSVAILKISPLPFVADRIVASIKSVIPI